MKKSKFMTLTFLVLGVAVTSWARETKIENTGPTQKVILGDKLAEALKKYDSNFRVLAEADFTAEAKELFPADIEQTPMAIKGDFNGDTFPDYALFGTSKGQYVAIAAIGEGTEWKIYSVRKFDKKDLGDSKSGLDVYLSLLESKEIQWKPQKGLSKRDAVQVEFFRGDTKAYYFDGQKIQEYKGKPL